MKGYPNWFSWIFISLILSLVFFSGIIMIPTALHMRLEWEVPWRLSGESRIAVTALHVFFSFVTLVILGALSSIHMRQGWKKKSRRASGISLVGFFAFLTITALGIYYFGNENLSLIASVGHMTAGVFLLFVYLAHVFIIIRFGSFFN